MPRIAHSTTRRRLIAAGTCAALAAAGAVPLLASDAAAVTETISNGDLTITVEPTSALANGQAINVTVQANNGATINQIDANQCLDGDLENQFEFSFDGGFCAQSPLSPAHEAQKTIGPFPPGSTPSATFTYVVGTGEQDTTDLFGEVKHIDCTTSCFFNLYIQYSGNPDVQWGTPISFGAAPTTTRSTTTSTTTTTTTPPTTTSSTTSTTTTTTTTRPTTTSTSTTTVPTSTSTTTSTTTTRPTTTSTTSTTTTTTVPTSTSTTSTTTATTVPTTASTTTTTTRPTTTSSTSTSRATRTTRPTSTTRPRDPFTAFLAKLIRILFRLLAGIS